jgi:hypothetical protein
MKVCYFQTGLDRFLRILAYFPYVIIFQLS